MSKSYKDKANYFSHHRVPDSPYAMRKGKHKYELQDMPESIKPMIEKLNYRNAGNRHGINRHMLSERKVIERRLKRAKEKSDLLFMLKHNS